MNPRLGTVVRARRGLAGAADDLAEASRELRRDRELASCGAEDRTPTEFYTRADAERARAQARRRAARWGGSLPHIIPPDEEPTEGPAP